MKETIEVPVDLLIGLADAASESGYPIAGDAYELINEHKKKTEGDKFVLSSQMKTTIERTKETGDAPVDALFSHKSLLGRIGYVLPCVVVPDILADNKTYLSNVLEILNDNRSMIKEVIRAYVPLMGMDWGRHYPEVTPSGLRISRGPGCVAISMSNIKFMFSIESDPTEWTNEMERLLKSKIEETP